GVVALTGPPDRARALARAIVCQLAAFHAPDDLRLVAASPPGARPAWRWMELLPHCGGGGSAGARPHPVVIIDAIGRWNDGSSPGAEATSPTRPLADAAADELLERTTEAGGTVIWLAETVSGEPSELSMRVRLDDHGLATLQATAPGGRLGNALPTDLADLGSC